MLSIISCISRCHRIRIPLVSLFCPPQLSLGFPRGSFLNRVCLSAPQLCSLLLSCLSFDVLARQKEGIFSNLMIKSILYFFFVGNLRGPESLNCGLQRASCLPLFFPSPYGRQEGEGLIALAFFFFFTEIKGIPESTGGVL